MKGDSVDGTSAAATSVKSTALPVSILSELLIANVFDYFVKNSRNIVD